MKSSIDVSILIVSYNTRALLLECVESVYRQTAAARFEIIVLDNGSSDGSAVALAHRFPECRLLVRKDNCGFAAANNKCARLARGEYLLLLNPDTVILNSAIDKLVECAREFPDSGIYGGRTIFADGTLNPTSCHRRPSLWGLSCRALGLSSLFRTSAILNVDLYGGWDRKTLRYVDVVSGCFMLIKRDLWNALDGFDEGFFMYCEEVDFCMRAARMGAKPLVCPSAEIIHYGGRSEKSHADKIMKLMASQIRLLRKHWMPTAAGLAKWLLLLNIYRRWKFWQLISAFGASGQRQSPDTFREVWLRRSEWLAEHSRGNS